MVYTKILGKSTMKQGDLVFCQGFRGLIVETSHGTFYTEHRIYWFGIHDHKPFSWVDEKQLLRIA